MIKQLYKYCFVASAIFIIDRVTKIAALTYLQAPRIINKYLSFELTFNRGVSWGIFHDATNTAFIGVSVIIAIITAFLVWHAYDMYKKGNSIIGHVCIIAGSISNLIDRAVYGGVIDFIVLSYYGYSWPVFNIADVAIVCGVGLFIWVDEQA
jgi:signal peptidase II